MQVGNSRDEVQHGETDRRVAMQRDPKTGRFLPGNRCAVGNRGNRTPKWGNRNAVKHGFFARAILMRPYVGHDGWLNIPEANLKLSPEVFVIEEDRIFVRDDILEMLKARGVRIDD